MVRLYRYSNTVLELLPHFLIEPTGPLIPLSDGNISIEQEIQSLSKVDGIPQLTALLRKILIFEPHQRLGIAGILSHPWLKSP